MPEEEKFRAQLVSKLRQQYQELCHTREGILSHTCIDYCSCLHFFWGGGVQRENEDIICFKHNTTIFDEFLMNVVHL